MQRHNPGRQTIPDHRIPELHNIDSEFVDNAIPVTIGQSITWCLIDTGASINCVNAEFLKQLPLSVVRQVKSSDIPQVRVADGNIVPVTKQVELTIKISQKVGRKNKVQEFTANFYVLNGWTYDLLLGTSFLKSHRAVIDFNCRTINLKPLNVHTDTDVTIPARSETVRTVSLKAKSKVPVNCMGIVNGCRPLGKTAIVTARVLSTARDGQVVLRFANPTSEDVIVPTGTKVGTFEMLPPNVRIINLLQDAENGQRPCAHNLRIPRVSTIETSHPAWARDLAELDKHLDMSQSDLGVEQKAELRNLLHRYREVFALSDKELGCAATVKHKINLVPGATPVSLRPYRTNPYQKSIIEQQVQQMLEADIIEESRSAWAAPVVLVGKPGGQPPRFCVDYRQLNQQTVNDCYPMPRVDEALDTIGQAQPKFFTTLDLRSGHWQIAMDRRSKEMTAFVSSAGLYHFKKMPFGLKTAPSTFQQLMSDLFRTMNWKNVLIYLDDIILFSSSFKQHLQHIEEVLVKLKQADLRLKPQKCHFAKPEVQYLGHIISREGIRPDRKKCTAVQEARWPFNLRTLRAFLGTHWHRTCPGRNKDVLLDRKWALHCEISDWTMYLLQTGATPSGNPRDG